MQEIIAFIIVALALIYLIVKFVFKRKSHQCDKCELSGKLKEDQSKSSN
ncbi:MAG: FeoB-associated Cys-rich membrane protein [Vicingus serpentipes]|nr:FeoB-associated Cys-rich membrane protein [Vicingus serpentipes]